MALRNEMVFNLGQSVPLGAAELARLASDLREKREARQEWDSFHGGEGRGRGDGPRPARGQAPIRKTKRTVNPSPATLSTVSVPPWFCRIV